MPDLNDLLPQTFYLRPPIEVAPELLGKLLHREGVRLRITEVEAYGGMEDGASHCRFGRTRRNAPMWRCGGRTYVFFCYGAHHMLNVVTGPEHAGGAVLVRSCEPVEGLPEIEARRGHVRGPALLAGPGRVAQALGIDLAWNDHLLYEAGGLELLDGPRPDGILVGPRVGVDYAGEPDRSAPMRFAAAHTPWVTHPRQLLPW